jgi:SNARE protein
MTFLFNNFNSASSLIKEFDRILKDEESNNPPEINKQLNDRK